MATTQDLTTNAAVKAWLPGNLQSANDVAINPLIGAASRAIYSYLGRPAIMPRSIVEPRDGAGGYRLQLRHWPVISVSSVVVDGVVVPPASAAGAAPTTGWRVEADVGYPPGKPQLLYLMGYALSRDVYDFGRGKQNVVVTYKAGYQTSEALVAAASVTPAQALGPWWQDGGVTYASSGVALTPVASAPAVGQYVPPTTGGGSYQFNAGDAGQAVVATYGYVPADLQTAACMLVGEWFKKRDRIGMRSSSLAQNETTTYEIGPLPAHVQAMLNPYRRVV